MKTIIALSLLILSTVSVQTAPPLKAKPKAKLATSVRVLVWDASAFDCTGAAITGVYYNAYYVAGAGPVPFVTETDPDCGPVNHVDTSLASKMNGVPITTTTYSATLGSGIYTVAIEAVSSDGTRGSYAELTLKIGKSPKPPTNLKIR